MLAGQAPGGHRGEGEVLGEVAGEATKLRFTGRRTMRWPPSVVLGGLAGWRRAKTSTS